MAFSGTVASDFLKITPIPDIKKSEFINYAGMDFVSAKQSLIDYAKAVYASDFSNFSESDLGLFLIDLAAYVMTVNSQQTDMVANENYLRTVKSRNNLRKMLELISTSLKGPTAAVGNAKITFTQTPAFPVTLSPENRVLTITSPQDGSRVTYTIYKLSNGSIQNIEDADAIISFIGAESDNSTSTVFTNVALVEGAFAVQKGTFAGNESIKNVALTESPVIEGSVQVFIDAPGSLANGTYRQVNNLFEASSPTDKVFQMVYQDSFTANIIFGDGVLGISPPNAVDYTITYRVGGGSRGNVPSKTILATLADDDSNPFTITNIKTMSGGADAETTSHAKKYLPYVFKSQNRLVTLQDYISFANTFRSSIGTVGKSTAVQRDAYSSGNIVDVYVLEKASDTQLKKASPTFKSNLLSQIAERKMLTEEVVVVDGLIRTLDLIVTARINRNLQGKEEEIKGKIKNVILEFFNVDNFDFGKPFILSELEREIFNLEDVVYAEVDNFDSNITVDFNEIIQLNNFTINIIFV